MRCYIYLLIVLIFIGCEKPQEDVSIANIGDVYRYFPTNMSEELAKFKRQMDQIHGIEKETLFPHHLEVLSQKLISEEKKEFVIAYCKGIRVEMFSDLLISVAPAKTPEKNTSIELNTGDKPVKSIKELFDVLEPEKQKKLTVVGLKMQDAKGKSKSVTFLEYLSFYLEFVQISHKKKLQEDSEKTSVELILQGPTYKVVFLNKGQWQIESIVEVKK